MNKKRKQNLKEARSLQIWNVIYDIIEVVLSLIAGFTANSSALIGWGLDSTIEVISAGTLGWRLHGEIKGLDERLVAKRKMTTMYVIAISFALICLFISYDSITKLMSQETASWSTTGIVILIVSLWVNPILIYYKRMYVARQA